MSDIYKQISGFRFVEVNQRDTLQSIAFREFGDASRWASLAAINNLLPPYITDDPLDLSERVLHPGQLLTIPAASTTAGANTDPETVFETDCLLQGGRLVVSNGDFLITSGRANLRQSLSHAVQTRRGELMFHGDYGCLVRRILGTVGNETAAILAAQYVRTTLEADERVAQVTQSVAVIVGDSVVVTAEVIPIAGRSINLQVSI